MNEHGTMQFDDETLMAYADGELDASTRAAIDAAIASDEQLAAKVEQYRQLRVTLSSAFGGVIQEPVPESLIATARSAPAGNVTSLAQARETRVKRRWSWPEWGAIAASLVLGIVIARVGGKGDDTFASRDGRVFAAGTLAHALNEQHGTERATGSDVEIGLTYKATSGEFCRTFTGLASVAGVACHSDRGWEIQALAHADGQSAEGYRMAETSMPPLIRQYVESSMDGEALDAQAENDALARKWAP